MKLNKQLEDLQAQFDYLTLEIQELELTLGWSEMIRRAYPSVESPQNPTNHNMKG